MYLGQVYSFSELQNATEKLAAGLQGCGLQGGDKAIIYLPKGVPYANITFLESVFEQRS
ncbi:MAG: hypothetical protein JRI84_07505, partial [Deltaproteobacteria bacterium]|nr:hypothetical protein [Deltaproteobacteria bacterium]